MDFCHNFSAPPETIEFFDEGAVGPDFPSGSVDMELKKGEELTYNVTCKASNSRPAPAITWYMGDDEVLTYDTICINSLQMHLYILFRGRALSKHACRGRMIT